MLTKERIVCLLAATVRATSVAVVVLACRSQQPVRSPTPSPLKRGDLDVARLPATAAVALIDGNRLEVVFPVLPLAMSRCESATTVTWATAFYLPRLPDTAARSQLSAREIARLLDQPSRSAFTSIVVRFPEGTASIQSRLDSALARAAFLVRTEFTPAHADVAPTIRTIEPESAIAYLDHNHLHSIIEGQPAVDAFALLEPDSLQLLWGCDRTGLASIGKAPLIRR